MKERCILWLVLLCFITSAIAQNALPPVNEITTDTSIYAVLFSKEGNNWQKLEDHTGKLTLTQIVQPPLVNNFHVNTSSKFDLSVYAYWYRYRLKNSMEHDIRVVIPTTAGYCDVYTKDEQQKWKHYQTGWLVPWSSRDGLKYFTQIAFNVKQGEELLIYQREIVTSYLVFNSKDVTPIGIAFRDKAIQQNYVDNDFLLILPSYLYIIIGLSLLAAFFNLFFYSVIHEKVYLYFSLFLMALATNRFFAGTGPLTATTCAPVFREYPFISTVFFYTSIALTIFYLTHFTRYYLEVFNYHPKWNRFLKRISYIFFLILIAPFLLHFLSDGWNKIWILSQIAVQDSTLFFILITFLLYVPVKSLARLRVIYVLPFLLLWGGVVPVLDIYTVLIPQLQKVTTPGWLNWIGDWFYVIELPCVTWMVFYFSWSLFKQFRFMQDEIAQQALEREIERSQLIEQQKTELERIVDERTTELKHSLENLKATQKQLIQNEKMASLGELTAGIAHEIQNPLNFVNNFSEINTELIEELKQEAGKGNYEEVIAITKDLEENEQKIIHHGKRADSIVKGMLQHSKTNTGKQELTNINALVDESLRLSYHGLRAKEKEFNATINTDFDENIGKINIVPQDISRVLLNIFNNAFYAVNEKKAKLNGTYEPTISVCTNKLNDKVEILIKDNGNGIPQAIRDKIFQPFFTTKPTGQGTGLGLSLSYDIIKAHGGEIKVESREGEGTTFIIRLPNVI